MNKEAGKMQDIASKIKRCFHKGKSDAVKAVVKPSESAEEVIKKMFPGDSKPGPLSEFVEELTEKGTRVWKNKDPKYKTAGMFTDDQGNMTTGTKVGLGALGLGLGGLGLYNYMQPDELASAVQQGPVLSRGLMGDISDAKEYASDKLDAVGTGISDAAQSVKNSALEMAKAFQGATGDAKTEAGRMTDYFLHGDQKAIDILNKAK